MRLLKVAVESTMIKIITGIRRCGKSYMLSPLFHDYLLSRGVRETHIIKIALDDLVNEHLLEGRILLEHLRGAMTEEGRYYILLDEVQMVSKFERVLSSLMQDRRADIYVTGSNSRFLSSDVATEFRGRAIEIPMYPLSMAEMHAAFPDEPVTSLWQKYIRYGGLPQVVELLDDRQKARYLQDLFTTVYSRDIVERYHIQKSLEFDELIRILASSIGSPVNPRRLSDTFRSTARTSLTPETISRFTKHAQDAFLIERAERYDVKGKKYINTLGKIYFTDLGLRNAVLGFRQLEESHLMENAIYNELRIRGFRVDIGSVAVYAPERRALEIDFVAQRGSSCYYIQSAMAIPDRAKMEQETRSLRAVGDSFRKVVIVRDQFEPWHTEDGILVLSLYDFMLNPDAMDA